MIDVDRGRLMAGLGLAATTVPMPQLRLPSLTESASILLIGMRPARSQASRR